LPVLPPAWPDLCASAASVRGKVLETITRIRPVAASSARCALTELRGVHEALKPVTSLTKAQRTREHAAKVAWRITHDWLDAQLALIDARMSTLDEVMLPFMVAPGGQTMFELYRGKMATLET